MNADRSFLAGTLIGGAVRMGSSRGTRSFVGHGRKSGVRILGRLAKVVALLARALPQKTITDGLSTPN